MKKFKLGSFDFWQKFGKALLVVIAVMPAAGIMIGSTLGNAGEQGYYWASSCLTSFPSFAWMLHFNSNYVLVDYYQRFYGRTIRPVCP